jgi:hypothetical protein
VPAATAVVLGRGIGFLSSFLRPKLKDQRSRSASRVISVCCAVFVAVAGVSGLVATARLAREGPRRPPVWDYVTETVEEGGTYLVPLGFKGFRIDTGAPIFVDWKSHPYRDTEFLEWFNRANLAWRFYEAPSDDAAIEALSRIRAVSPITHVIAYERTRRALAHAGLRQVYDGPGYAVFEIADPGSS